MKVQALIADDPPVLSLPCQSRLDLISGGARSGKSRFAVETALRSGENRLFVATAQAWDAEILSKVGQRDAGYDRNAAYGPSEMEIANPFSSGAKIRSFSEPIISNSFTAATRFASDVWL